MEVLTIYFSVISVDFWLDWVWSCAGKCYFCISGINVLYTIKFSFWQTHIVHDTVKAQDWLKHMRKFTQTVRG
jgi:hypothetical protein